MQSDFKPKYLKKANKILSKDLRAIQADVSINKVYEKEIFSKPSLWEKFLSLFKP